VLRGNFFDENIDVWAIGVIFFKMLYGIFPFD